MDNEEYHYQKRRIVHWDRVSDPDEKQKRIGAFYHKLLRRYYKSMVREGLRILELGCSHGDLLACLKPSFGVGIDFSGEMIKRARAKYPHLSFVQADVHDVAFREKFDVLILSDLINDLWDVQRVFEQVRTMCHSRTRIVFNFYNNLWRIPLSIIRCLGLGANVLEQNWLSPNDVINLLKLSGFEIIKSSSHILLPLKIPLLSSFLNRYIVQVPPFSWFALANFMVAGLEPSRKRRLEAEKEYSVSVIIPARNEAGNIEEIFERVPSIGKSTELVFVEGCSKDNTYDTIQQTMARFPGRRCRLLQQTGTGKGDAVRLGFEKAEGDVLMILDADMTVPPEDLTRFFHVLVSGKGEFINGVRLVYPLADQSMRFMNILGNKFFSLAFSWLLGQPVKDTLCGTKVVWKDDYESMARNRSYFGDFDPFGDFDLLFGATKLNLKIVEMPIRYRSRMYGDTNISRWSHGWLLLKMVFFAAKKIKFI
ncbi:MAG: glycosyltransferase [Desulfobacterales bacterium]|nr:glycosyltransferase [Desulfobacterales bacterium]